MRVRVATAPVTRRDHLGMLRWVILFLAAGLGLSRLKQLATTPYLFDPGRDFVPVYLLPWAIAHGYDPNTRISDLARIAGLPLPDCCFPHPTPQPPTLGVLLFPLSWIDFRTAALVWLVVSVGSLFAATALLVRANGLVIAPLVVPLVALAVIPWGPATGDLLQGQVMLFMLALVAGMWAALRTGQRRLAGLLLAASLMVKPILWPVGLFLVVRRRWQTVSTCVAGCTGWCLLTTIVIGPEPFVRYLTVSLPAVTASFQGFWTNISLWGVGWRLFSGHEWQFGNGTRIVVSPIADVPLAAQAVAIALPAITLISTIWLVRRQSLDSAIAVLIGVSIVVSPIAWTNYLVLLLVPVARVVPALRTHRRPTAIALVLAVALLASTVSDSDWLGLVATWTEQTETGNRLGAVPSLVTWMPLVAVGAVTALVLLAPAGNVRPLNTFEDGYSNQ